MSCVCRIVKTKYAETAFTGEGAKLYGGRWNSRGRRAIYTAESIALAALELLVHLQSDQVLSAYTLFQLTLNDEQIMVLDERTLPADWNREPAPRITARIGDEWLDKRPSLALKVPSVIVPEEHIFVLNPAHPDYPEMVGRACSRPFRFDARLTVNTSYRNSSCMSWGVISSRQGCLRSECVQDSTPERRGHPSSCTGVNENPPSRYCPGAAAH